jgi:hypothetical protein
MVDEVVSADMNCDSNSVVETIGVGPRKQNPSHLIDEKYTFKYIYFVNSYYLLTYIM